MARLIGNDANETVIDGRSDDITDLQNDLDSELASVLSSLDADENDDKIHLKVYQLKKGHAKGIYCFTANVAELPLLDRLRDEWGEGSYQINVIKNNRLARKIPVDIRVPIKAPAPIANNTDISSVLDLFMRAQQESAARMEALMTRLSTPATPAVVAPSAPAFDWKNLPIILSSGAAAITALKEMFGGNKTDPLEMAVRIAEVMGDRGGGGDTGLMDVVKEFIKSPALGEAAKALTASAGAQGHVTTVRPTPAPGGSLGAPPPIGVGYGPNPLERHMGTAPGPVAAPADAAQPNEGDTVGIMDFAIKTELRKYMPMLMDFAAKGQDLSGYSYPLVANAPRALLEPFCKRTDFLDVLASIDPNVVNFADNIEGLRRAILDEYTMLDGGDLTESGE